MFTPIERPRLFADLDAVGGGTIVWLVAAGGYGKTTLALTYAHHRALRLIHFTGMHSGVTVGEFFHGLRARAMETMGALAERLPVLNPEYTATPDVFARRFAEEMAAILPREALVMVDDVHRLPADHPLHPLLLRVADTVSGRCRFVVGSRHEPPGAWARLRGQGRVVVIDEAMLAFDEQETGALLDAQGLASSGEQEAGRSLRLTTRGWVVGLMLLLEHWRRTGAPPHARHAGDSLDDWFYHEIYAPLPMSEQTLLRRCALPARVPLACAADGSGIVDAREGLLRLQREHAFIFTDTHDEGDRVCRFHDLFRDFLLRRAETEATPAELAAQRRRWGRVLWAAGEWSEGANLLIEAGDEDALAEGLKNVGGELIQTGRGDSLFGWLNALPEARRREEPVLCLWEGLCLMLHDTHAARQLLSRAWESLAAAQDYPHMALAWSGIVDSIWLEWAHVSEYERWIDEFLHFEAEFRAHLPPALWFPVLRGMLAAVCYGRPLDPSLARWEREALSALSGDMPDTERVMLACQLLYLNTWQFGCRAGAMRVLAVMEGQQAAVDGASPLAQCLWRTFTALCALLFDGDRERCLAEADKGRALIREYGIGTWDDAVPPLHCALCFHDGVTLDDWMAWFLRTDCKANRPFYDTFQAHFLSAQAWLRGNVHEAVEHARMSLVAGERHGSVVISAGFRAVYAGFLAEAGHGREALRAAAQARAIARGFRSDFLEVFMYLALARIPLHTARPWRALGYLRRAFAAGARQWMFFPLLLRDGELAMLCALALAEGIEPDYARWLIRVRDLTPPADRVLRAHWPWRCRVRVLGGFSVEVGERHQYGSRRAQPLPRALLARLVIAGPKGETQERLAACLWPDSERDKALNSLYVTLHRLRDRVLEDPGAVVSQGGRIRLDPDRVWVDAWEFRALAARGEREGGESLQRAVELYGGVGELPGLDEIDLEAWQAELDAIYERAVRSLGVELEHDDVRAALRLYREALDHLRLSESLWAGVLRCEAALGNQAALKRSFSHLAKCFRRELDTEPSPWLASLYQRLRG
ncbi:BTAD domain-containing putative transcriptional regulator [Arhodomonas sp. AD133]|uniref:BTAD domain-containing putative transcriptional regulator n=1 Tax=Arhodomonas sp. AD133 TaxID=3415009 RepID=UPI003EBC2E69